MTLLACTILGNPVGKGRPRVTTVGGFARAYTPAKTATWEANAAAALCEAFGLGVPYGGAVEVSIHAVAARPKRLLTRAADAGRLWRTTKPDADNVAKAVCDALVAGGVLRDDTQVVRLEVESLYASKTEGPRVEVRMQVARERPAQVYSLEAG